MANKHFSIGEENAFEITLKLKVIPKSISDYRSLTCDDIESELDEFKEEINEFLVGEICKEYYQKQITMGVDWWNFNIEEIK